MARGLSRRSRYPVADYSGSLSRRRWSYGLPMEDHATWCNAQPPAPVGSCSCHRSRTARVVRKLMGAAS